MNILTKIKLKNTIGFIIFTAIILLVSFILNRFIQMLIFVCTFNIIQECFLYRFHADNIIQSPKLATIICKIVTVATHIFYLIFCNRLSTSIYSNLLLIISIAFISCILSIASKVIFTKSNIFNNKDDLLYVCAAAKLSTLSTNRLVMKYIEKMSIKDIATLECVDVETIRQSIKRSKHKLKELNLID